MREDKDEIRKYIIFDNINKSPEIRAFIYVIKKNEVSMKLIYIIFFLILNLYIFSHITKKIKFSLNIQIGVIFFLITFILCHFLNVFDTTISNEVFTILLLFSGTFFIFHFGRNITIWFTTRLNNNRKDELLFRWFNFWVNYVIYAMIFIFQIATLIDN